MKWMRGIAAVLAGYVVSLGLNGLFVYFWYFGDRSVATPLLAGMTVAFFVVVGVGSGILTGWVAGSEASFAGWATALLIVGVAVGNIMAGVAAEPLWHKLLVIVVMAPLVGILATRTARGTIAGTAG